MNRTKITVVVACAALIAGLLITGRALLADGSDDPGSRRTAGGSPTAAASATPSAKPGQLTKDTDGNITSFAVPTRSVDPTRGRSYCETVRLLSVYSRQGYGLSKAQTVVNGRKFQLRLKVIAATYERLADQAADTPKAGPVARPWRTMASMAVTTEEQLRVNGLQVQSQAMVVQLAELAQTSRVQLPKAAATLAVACGYSPAVLGL